MYVVAKTATKQHSIVNNWPLVLVLAEPRPARDSETVRVYFGGYEQSCRLEGMRREKKCYTEETHRNLIFL